MTIAAPAGPIGFFTSNPRKHHSLKRATPSTLILRSMPTDGQIAEIEALLADTNSPLSQPPVLQAGDAELERRGGLWYFYRGSSSISCPVLAPLLRMAFNV